MPKKTFTPQQIVPKPRQIEVLIGQEPYFPSHQVPGYFAWVNNTSTMIDNTTINNY